MWLQLLRSGLLGRSQNEHSIIVTKGTWRPWGAHMPLSIWARFGSRAFSPGLCGLPYISFSLSVSATDLLHFSNGRGPTSRINVALASSLFNKGHLYRII